MTGWNATGTSRHVQSLTPVSEIITHLSLTSGFLLPRLFSSAMSEYWVSKKKYFCQYCDIFIADDAPSRSHHENGMRHKGNKERFVKGLYKAGEKMKKDADEEKREMKNIEAAAQRAFALDVGAGRGGIGGSGLPAPKTAPAPPKKPSNPYANYSTAASLGYTDPDAERVQAEAERRQTQGVAGDWELLPSTSALLPTAPLAGIGDDGDVKPAIDDTISPGTKREAEAPAEDDEDGRAWKLRKKTARLGDIYDPGDIPIKLKVKKLEESAQAESTVAANGRGEIATSGGSIATDVPKWTKTQWKRAADPAESTQASNTDKVPGLTSSQPTPLANSSPLEEASQPDTGIKDELTTPKLEEPSSELPPSAGGNLFKKRKARGGAAAGRGKRDQF